MKKSITILISCFVLAILLSPMMTIADPLVIGSTGVTSPDRTENFDSKATPVTGVSNEFAASGLQFSTTNGNGIQLTTNSDCGNFGRGVTNSYLYMGLSGPCHISFISDAVSIAFDVNVSELSWTGFSRARFVGFSIQRVLNGIIVESDLLDGGNMFENRTVLLAGTVFDELRFVENGNTNTFSFFALDNFAWKLVMDADGDGVQDNADNCPETVIPESVPTESLGVNRFALTDDDGLFDTTSPNGIGPGRSYNIDDTMGCSCTQIIDALGLGNGHTEFGCSISAMDDWLTLVN